MERIIIYTDGACRGNPGRGAYAFILRYIKKEKVVAKGFRLTTNNRMELLAVIAGLEELKTNTIPVDIYSDSKYVVDSVNKGWLDKWMKNDFKGGKKNKDLWTKYYNLSKQFVVELKWVKGHSNHPDNEHCDKLATYTAETQATHIDMGYEKVALI